MRTSILLAIQRGGKPAQLLAGPEMPIAEQKAMIRDALTGDKTDDEIAELQHWTSDEGIQRVVKFALPRKAKS